MNMDSNFVFATFIIAAPSSSVTAKVCTKYWPSLGGLIVKTISGSSLSPLIACETLSFRVKPISFVNLLSLTCSRSEERRIGKECRSRCSPDHQKKERNYKSVHVKRS